MLATINPVALPTLRIVGLLFLAFNVFAGAYFVRHWREFFARDPSVDGDVRAARYLRIVVITVPFLVITFRLFELWLELWIK